MNEHVEEWLVDYLNGSLPEARRAGVEAHLAGCAGCRRSLHEWQQIAGLVSRAAEANNGRLPLLSHLVRRQVRPRPTLREAMQASTALVWGQRAILLRSGTLPAVALVIFLGVLAALFIQRSGPDLVALPLFILTPMLAILAVVYLHTTEADPAFEIVAAAPTSPGVLVFARLTLALATLGGLALLGSLGIGGLSGAPLHWLVGAWLGPLLLLSALATLLSLAWNPLAATGVSLALWGVVSVLVAATLQSDQPIRLLALAVLRPGWPLLAGQAALASLLWLAGWLLLERGALVAGQLGGRE